MNNVGARFIDANKRIFKVADEKAALEHIQSLPTPDAQALAEVLWRIEMIERRLGLPENRSATLTRALQRILRETQLPFPATLDGPMRRNGRIMEIAWEALNDGEQIRDKATLGQVAGHSNPAMT